MYCLIRSKGYNAVKTEFSKASFYRLVGDLLQCGFSRAYLMNLNENDSYKDMKSIDLLNVFDIDFDRQLPEWYVKPKSQFNYEVVA